MSRFWLAYIIYIKVCLCGFDNQAAEPYAQQAEGEATHGIGAEAPEVATLQQRQHIVAQRREGGEAAAEARNQKGVHSWRDDAALLNEAKQHTDDEATHDVHYKSSPRPRRADKQRGRDFANQKAQAGANHSTESRYQH